MRPCLMRQRLCPAASFPGRSRAVVPGPAFARQSVHIRTATSSAAALVDDDGGSAVLSFKADRSSFPEGLPDLVDHASLYNSPALKRKWRKEQSALPRDVSILRRKKESQVIARIEKALAADELESLASGILLSGSAGSGKSLALLSIVRWAKATGWLTVYIPNARQWTHGQYWEPHPARPGSLAQLDLAFNFLTQLAEANADIIGSIPMKHELYLGEEVVGLPALGPAHGSTLADLLGLVGRFNTPGKDEPKGTLAVDPYIIGVAEHVHRELCDQTEYPLLVAIDQFNFFFDRSGYRDLPDKSHGLGQGGEVAVDRLRMCELFLDMHSKRSLAYGVLVGASCLGHAPVAGGRHTSSYASEMAEFKIPRFDRDEVWAMLQHYHEVGTLSMPVDDALVARAIVVTQNCPRELHRFAIRH